MRPEHREILIETIVLIVVGAILVGLLRLCAPAADPAPPDPSPANLTQPVATEPDASPATNR